MKLKRARLADDLNEKIAQRPGAMELVEKNILRSSPPTDNQKVDSSDPCSTSVFEKSQACSKKGLAGPCSYLSPQTALFRTRTKNLPASATLDVYKFDEDVSDALSPKQPASQSTPGSSGSREAGDTETDSCSSQSNSMQVTNSPGPLDTVLRKKLLLYRRSSFTVFLPVFAFLSSLLELIHTPRASHSALFPPASSNKATHRHLHTSLLPRFPVSHQHHFWWRWVNHKSNAAQAAVASKLVSEILGLGFRLGCIKTKPNIKGQEKSNKLCTIQLSPKREHELSLTWHKTEE